MHTGLNKSHFLKKLTEDEIKNTHRSRLIDIPDREGVYIETSSIQDKYKMRPISLKHMCLAKFAKRYERVRDGSKIQDE